MEMKSEYQNFNKIEEQNEEEEAETSFGGNEQDDDDFEDAEDNLLFDKSKDLKKGASLPFTIDEKRAEIKKRFGDTFYNDSASRQMLDNITFENSPDADNIVKVFYEGLEIATININTGKVELNLDNRISSGYKRDHDNIISYRNSTFVGQIEENTGERGDINLLIAENIKKKFVREIQKREGLKDPSEHIEMVQLQEDFARLERGKKLETGVGREILDSQVWYTRRVIELKKVLEKVPGIGFLLASAVGVVTAIVLLGKGLFYDGGKNIRPSKKKSKKDQDIIDQSLQKAQEISSEILEKAGDNFEVMVTIATIALIIYKIKS